MQVGLVNFLKIYSIQVPESDVIDSALVSICGTSGNYFVGFAGDFQVLGFVNQAIVEIDDQMVSFHHEKSFIVSGCLYPSTLSDKSAVFRLD